MQMRRYCCDFPKGLRWLKWLVLSFLLLSVSGCYQTPTAERLDYDPETVEMLRQEIRGVDWDE